MSHPPKIDPKTYEFMNLFNIPLQKAFATLPESELSKIEDIYLKLNPKMNTVFMDVFFLYLTSILRNYNSNYMKILQNYWKLHSQKIIIPYFVYNSPKDYDILFDKEDYICKLLNYAINIDKNDPDATSKYIFFFQLLLDELPIKMTQKEFLAFNEILTKRITKASELAKNSTMNPTHASRIFNTLLKRRIIRKKGLLNLNKLGFDIFLVIAQLREASTKRMFLGPWTYSEILSINDDRLRFMNFLIPRYWISKYQNPYQKLSSLISENKNVDSVEVFKFYLKGSSYNFSNFDFRTGKWKAIDYNKILQRWESGNMVPLPPQSSNNSNTIHLKNIHLKILQTIWDYGPLSVKELRHIVKINYNQFIKYYNALKENNYFAEAVFPSLHLTKNEIFLMAETTIDEWRRIAYALMENPILYYGLYESDDNKYYGVYHIRTSETGFNLISTVFREMVSKLHLAIFNEITKEKIWTLPIERWNEEKQHFEILEDDFIFS